MAELKHIGEVEQVVEVQENDNLIGERDGRAVRIPTNKVISEGMVKSVNGNTPDSEGNVDLPPTIPSVQTAQVGQTVVVKAVDENGKPTEWEAADAGGGGASYIKHSSSAIISDGTYNFVNPDDHSVIEPATNSKVREAFCKGLVFVVGGDPDVTSGNIFHMSPILNLIGSSESNISYYLKGFAGSGIQDITFSIYDE